MICGGRVCGFGERCCVYTCGGGSGGRFGCACGQFDCGCGHYCVCYFVIIAGFDITDTSHGCGQANIPDLADGIAFTAHMQLLRLRSRRVAA
jgi:hypothetical protein